MLEAIRDDYVSDFLDGFRLTEIFRTDAHSDDFSTTRLQYLVVRLRFLLLLFTGLVAAWIVVDFFMLTSDHFRSMLVARVLFAAVLVVLWSLSHGRRRLHAVLTLLTVTMFATMIFYGAACMIFASGVAEIPNAGYQAIPLFAVAVLGLFPMTLTYSTGVITMIAALYVGLQFWLGRMWTPELLGDLVTLALMGGVVLWIQMGQLLMLLRLYRESTRDPLTGLINRRVLMKQLVAEIEMHEDTGRCFTLMMFDLDHFKWVNDSYGHLVGDRVLQNAAHLMAEELRASDIIARYGGEEFLAVLPGRNRLEAIPVAERIRHLFERRPIFVSPGGDAVSITTSIGVTEYESGERIEATLNRVDDYLYRAKQAGRNRVVSSVTGE